ncbi:MAG: acylphosphatase [Candidatus Diapherotrites archaeon]|nr:acylphosphatase [Candidatus Diapherotrites archaeon]
MFKRVHGIVSGRVQNVFFRAFTHRWANELELKGWVRNLHSGEVEFEAEGSEEALKELIKKIHKGTPLSKVESVELKWTEFKDEFKEFNVRY